MIATEDAERLAALSRIALMPEECARAKKDLSALLRMIDRLTRIDLPPLPSETEPIAADALRADVAVPGLPRETLLSQAPLSENGAFLLPERNDD